MNRAKHAKIPKLLLHKCVVTNPKRTAPKSVPMAYGEDLVCDKVAAKASVPTMTVYNLTLECSRRATDLPLLNTFT